MVFFYSNHRAVNKCDLSSEKPAKKGLKLKPPALVQRIYDLRGLFGAGSAPSHFVRFPTSQASHYVNRYCNSETPQFLRRPLVSASVWMFDDEQCHYHLYERKHEVCCKIIMLDPELPGTRSSFF
jgi:hypothetical protein